MTEWRVEEVDPTTDSRWDELTGTGEVDVFQTAPWIRSVTKPYGFTPRAVLVLHDNRPVGGAPFVEVDGAAGHRMVVGPFSDYCDPILHDDGAWALIAGYFEGLNLPVRFRFLRFRPTDITNLRPDGLARWHGLHLNRSPEELLASMDSAARRAIAKSERSGLEIVDAQDMGDLSAFYDIHVDVRRLKYRLLAQPISFFEGIWHEFIEKGTGRLSLAVSGGQVIAGVLFIEWKDRVYYKFNASRDEFLGLRPNDAIVWAAIRSAYENGRTLLDFGLSDWDQSGLRNYKLKFGSVEDVIRTYALGPPPKVPGLASVLGPLTLLLTDESLSRDFTTRAGELLYVQFA